MGFRFRKSIKVLPGVRVNVGAKGVSSVNVGRRGVASVTVGKRGTTVNVGTPVPGVSYSERLGGARGDQEPAPPPAATPGTWGSGVAWLLAGLALMAVAALVTR